MHGKEEVRLHFTVQVADIDHLNRVVRRLIDIEDVRSVIRRKAVRPEKPIPAGRGAPRRSGRRTPDERPDEGLEEDTL